MRPPSRLGCPGVRGEKHPLHKLTDEAVKEIRRTPESISALAKRFGVHVSTVKKARAAKTWKHVEGMFEWHHYW